MESGNILTCAERYDSVQQSFQYKYGIELIERLKIEKGDRVLDLGCGTGNLTSVLAEKIGRDGKVLGVDPDKERIALAQKKYANRNSVSFHEGSGVDFPSGPYDIIFSNFVLQWIEDKESTFHEVYDELKVGGTFVFLVPDRAERNPWELFPTIKYKSLNFLTCEEYEHLSLKCGFEVEFRSVDTVQHKFDSRDEFINFFESSFKVTVPEVKHLEPQMDWTRITYILKSCRQYIVAITFAHEKFIYSLNDFQYSYIIIYHSCYHAMNNQTR